MTTRSFVQAVRVADVVALGPAMVAGAVAAKGKLPGAVRAFLGISGVATILFNGYRLLRVASDPDPDRIDPEG